MSSTPEVTRGYAKLNGASLYYEVAGTGRPVLLLHAGIADSRMWDDQFHLFAQEFRVIRYDQRGFGRSDFPDLPFSAYEDARAMLDFLETGPAAVVGVSFGGKVAIDLCLAWPACVTALVLGAPSLGGQPPSSDVLQFQAEEEALLDQGDPDQATELNLRMWVDGPNRQPDQVDQRVRERVRAMQRQAFDIPIPEMVQERLLTPPAIGRLKEIQVPVLVLAGDLDRPSKLDTARHLANEILQAQLELLPDTAHMVNMEHPEVFNRWVLEFLRGPQG